MTLAGLVHRSFAQAAGTTSTTAASGGAGILLGDNLLPYLVLAIGAAMVVGPIAALLRPRDEPDAEPDDEGGPIPGRENDLARPPVARSIAFAAIGMVGVVWALATLVLG